MCSRHFERHHPFAFGRVVDHLGFIRCIGGKVQAVDAHHRHAYAIVEDDPDQFRQRRRAIAGAADGGGQGRHQMVERVADRLPALMNIEEGFDLQHGPDTTVASALMAALEQPAVDFLALELAGFDHLAEGRLGMVEQVAHQPQVQRVHLGDDSPGRAGHRYRGRRLCRAFAGARR